MWSMAFFCRQLLLSHFELSDRPMMAAEVTDVLIEEEEEADDVQAEEQIAEAIEDDANADGLAELNAKLDEIAVQLAPTELNPPYAQPSVVSAHELMSCI